MERATKCTMNDWLHQAWQEIAARPEGPLAMRFYIQPSMSTFFAIRDGLKDARMGRPPYFWSLFTDPTHRVERLKNGWRSIGKIFILAAVLDVVYPTDRPARISPAPDNLHCDASCRRSLSDCSRTDQPHRQVDATVAAELKLVETGVIFPSSVGVLPNSPPKLGGVARSAGVVPRDEIHDQAGQSRNISALEPPRLRR